MAKVEFDLQIITPSGDVDENLVGLPAVNIKIENPKYVQLAKTVVEFAATPKYSFGEYTFKVTARDLVAGNEYSATTVANLVQFELDSVLRTADESNSWMSGYYQNPTPFRAGGAFLDFARSKYPESAFAPLFAFYLELYQHNRWLIPYLLDCFHDNTDAVKSHIGWLVRLMEYQDADALGKLAQSDRDLIAALELPSLPNVDVEITDASQLDWLWGTFFASGSIEPIKQIVSALELQKYERSLNKWKEDSKKKGASIEPDKEVVLGLTYYAAQWSLRSNCAQHKLVRSYCRQLLEGGSLGSAAKKELKKILEP